MPPVAFQEMSRKLSGFLIIKGVAEGNAFGHPLFFGHVAICPIGIK